MAVQGRPVWNDHYVQLEEDMSDLEILERLDAVLKDEESLRRKSEIMGRIMRQEYSLDRYVERFAAVLEEIGTALPELPKLP